MPLRLRVLTTLLVVSLSSFACGGEPPTKEMQEAQLAIDAALAAGADRYALEEYSGAQEALQHSKQAVGERDYRLALSTALDSRERAQLAAQAATEKKAAARSESDTALVRARAMLAATKTRFDAAQADHAAAAALVAPKEALASAEAYLQEASAAFAQGDYVNANSQTASALQAMAAVSAGLEAAAPKRRR
jgi:hypothetical protein